MRIAWNLGSMLAAGRSVRCRGRCELAAGPLVDRQVGLDVQARGLAQDVDLFWMFVEGHRPAVRETLARAADDATGDPHAHWVALA